MNEYSKSDAAHDNYVISLVYAGMAGRLWEQASMLREEIVKTQEFLPKTEYRRQMIVDNLMKQTENLLNTFAYEKDKYEKVVRMEHKAEGRK